MGNSASTNEPIRVAHVMGKMMSGGVESVVMNYYRHIDRSRVQFDLIVDSDSTAVPIQEVEALGGRIIEVPPYQDIANYIPRLVSLFREENWQVVHSHLNTMSVFPLLAATLARVPVRIAHSHSTAGKGEKTKNFMKYSLRPFSKLFPTNLCGCSDYAAEWLFGKRAVELDRVRIWPNAIETEKFSYNAIIRKRLRSELNLVGHFIVGHIGRFTCQKNHDFLIDIFAEVKRREPMAKLLLVGEGELRTEIKTKVARLGLEGSVMFFGICEDVSDLYQVMDVFCLPSHYEGLPVVSVEAQAAGLRCVMSDAVTKEAKLIESTEFLSLRAGAGHWADALMRRANDGPTSEISRAVAAEDLAQRGYDLDQAASGLLRYYLDCLCIDSCRTLASEEAAR